MHNYSILILKICAQPHLILPKIRKIYSAPPYSVFNVKNCAQLHLISAKIQINISITTLFYHKYKNCAKPHLIWPKIRKHFFSPILIRLHYEQLCTAPPYFAKNIKKYLPTNFIPSSVLRSDLCPTLFRRKYK